LQISKSSWRFWRFADLKLSWRFWSSTIWKQRNNGGWQCSHYSQASIDVLLASLKFVYGDSQWIQVTQNSGSTSQTSFFWVQMPFASTEPSYLQNFHKSSCRCRLSTISTNNMRIYNFADPHVSSLASTLWGYGLLLSVIYSRYDRAL
jgi:hypothetical protein